MWFNTSSTGSKLVNVDWMRFAGWAKLWMKIAQSE